MEAYVGSGGAAAAFDEAARGSAPETQPAPAAAAAPAAAPKVENLGRIDEAAAKQQAADAETEKNYRKCADIFGIGKQVVTRATAFFFGLNPLDKGLDPLCNLSEQLQKELRKNANWLAPKLGDFELSGPWALGFAVGAEVVGVLGVLWMASAANAKPEKKPDAPHPPAG